MTMTPDEFKHAQRRLGLSDPELGRILDTNETTIRKWKASEHASTGRGPNPIACQVMRWMLAGFRPPEWPSGK